MPAEYQRPGRRTRRTIVKWLIKLGFTVAIFALIFHPEWMGLSKLKVTPGEIWDEVKALQLWVFLPWFFAGTAIKTLGIFASILRWRLLLTGQGIRLPLWHLTGSFLIGRYIGLLTPGTTGIDAYCFYDVGRYTGKWIESATVVAVNKLTGIISLTFLMFISLPCGLYFLDFNLPLLAALLVFLGAIIVISLACLLNPRILQVLIAALPLARWPRVEKRFQELANAVTAYSGQRPLLMKAVFLGLIVHFFTTLMYFCTAMAIRTEGLRMVHILFASPINIYATVIGPTVSGEGVREIVFMMLLGAHVGEAKTLLFSHLGFWAGEAVSFLGGLIMLMRPANYRPKASIAVRDSSATTPALGIPPARIQEYRQAIWATIKAATVGGVLGGALMGLGEAALILATSTTLNEYRVLPYGWIAYGLLGAGPGLGLAGLILFLSLWRDKFWAPRRVMAFSAGATFAALGYVCGRFILIRDFLGEQAPTRSDEAYFALFILMFFFLWRYGLSALAKWRPFHGLARLRGGLGVFALVAVACIGADVWKRAQAESPSPPPAAPPTLAEQPNVLLICIDTLRADSLGCYGHPEVATPAIDALAADGVRYENAIAQASWTRPSIGALLTGLYPSVHGASRKSDRIDSAAPTLAETLRDAGVYAAGLVNNPNIAPLHGFERGFDEYVYLRPKIYLMGDVSATRLTLYEILRRVRQKIVSRGNRMYSDVYDFYFPAEDVVDRAADWLERARDSRFFYFLHFMDPHDPYMIHPLEERKGYARMAWGELDPSMRDVLVKTYLGEIEYCDEHIGRLIARLKELGLYDDMAIILTSDHGEEFMEHGGWWHGRTLYEEMIRVPLIIKLPKNRAAGTVIEGQARLLDVAPTICDLFETAPPEANQGVSLLRDGHPYDLELDFVFSEEDFEGNVLQSGRTPDWKLHQANPGNPRGLQPGMLFNMRDFPGENFDLFSAQREKAMELSRKIGDQQRENAKAAEALRQ